MQKKKKIWTAINVFFYHYLLSVDCLPNPMLIGSQGSYPLSHDKSQLPSEVPAQSAVSAGHRPSLDQGSTLEGLPDLAFEVHLRRKLLRWHMSKLSISNSGDLKDFNNSWVLKHPVEQGNYLGTKPRILVLRPPFVRSPSPWRWAQFLWDATVCFLQGQGFHPRTRQSTGPGSVSSSTLVFPVSEVGGILHVGSPLGEPRFTSEYWRRS